MLRLLDQERYELKCCGYWIRIDMHCNVAAVGSGELFTVMLRLLGQDRYAL